MNYEVVVVGGGIGGLTAAALLAARGLQVCLFERQSQVGGCVATVDHQRLHFDPTFGLYSGWEGGGVYERLFKELRMGPPAVRELSPAYVVRLPGGVQVPAAENLDQLEQIMVASFPDCAGPAIQFYQELTNTPSAQPTFAQPVASHLTRCSTDFRRFIDVQLRAFAQRTLMDCTTGEAAAALLPRRYWNIAGGAQTLADALADSIKANGGSVRLNTPVLRLAYSADGAPVGVDLLSGERITATRAIVSNLTIWDTYGKLIGFNRAPAGISSQLRQLTAWGVYQIFMTIDRAAVAKLPAQRTLTTDDAEPENAMFLAVGSAGDADKLTATLSTFTPAEDWFSFHEDHEAHDTQDQAMLSAVWSRLHAAMPELGDSIEVIETATPQTYYDTTRRKFGMVGLPTHVPAPLRTSPFPNLLIVSDTISAQFGLASLTGHAIDLADSITK